MLTSSSELTGMRVWVIHQAEVLAQQRCYLGAGGRHKGYQSEMVMRICRDPSNKLQQQVVVSPEVFSVFTFHRKMSRNLEEVFPELFHETIESKLCKRYIIVVDLKCATWEFPEGLRKSQGLRLKAIMDLRWVLLWELFSAKDSAQSSCFPLGSLHLMTLCEYIRQVLLA